MFVTTKNNCRFFIKPIGAQSNKALAELLGQEIYASEQRGQRTRAGIEENGYEVTPDQLVTVFESARGSSGLKYEYRVRIKDVLNPVVLVPDQTLASVESITAMAADMVAKALGPKSFKSVPRGAMPLNVLPQRSRSPRTIKAVRCRTH